MKLCTHTVNVLSGLLISQYWYCYQ